MNAIERKDTGRFETPARSLWAEAGGPLLTVLGIGVVELLSQTILHLHDPSTLVLLAVVFSAYVGGLRPGLVSAALAWIYFAYFFSIPGRLFRYDEENLRRVIALGSITPAIVVMVGLLYRRSTHRVSLKLRESEERFRAFMDNSPTVAWMRDEQGRYVYVNTPFELTFNLRREDVLGTSTLKPWSEDGGRELREN